jgi:hypothetical protein
MTTTMTATSCRCCGRQVEDVMHVMLCDGCLDARLARSERTLRPLAVAAAALLRGERTPRRGVAFV